MSKHAVKTWQDVYVGLNKVGMNNSEIAELVGCSRTLISNVVNGTYSHSHEPHYSGALRALVTLKRRSVSAGMDLVLIKGEGAPVVEPYSPT